MADRDTWPDDPNNVPDQLPASGARGKSSGCLTAVLIAGGLGGLMMLVCCGGFGWIAYKSMPKIVTTPAEVAAVVQKIMKIDIPDDFVAETGMTIDNQFMEMRFATFQYKQQKGHLLLGAFRVKVGDPKMQKGAFQAHSNEQSMKNENLDVLKMESRDFTIRGQKVPFRFSEAEERGTKKKFRLVDGELEAPGGGQFFKLMLEEEVYDEDSVVKLIESIQ